MTPPPPKSSLIPQHAERFGQRPPPATQTAPAARERGTGVSFMCMCSNGFRELLHKYTLPMFRDDTLMIFSSGDAFPEVVSKFRLINERLAPLRESELLVYTGIDTLFLGRMAPALAVEMAGRDFMYASESRQGGVNGDFLVMRGTDAAKALLKEAAKTFESLGGRETDQSILSRLSRSTKNIRSAPLSLRFLNQSVGPSEAELAACLFFHANCRCGVPDKIQLLEHVLGVRRRMANDAYMSGRVTFEWRSV